MGFDIPSRRDQIPDANFEESQAKRTEGNKRDRAQRRRSRSVQRPHTDGSSDVSRLRSLVFGGRIYEERTECSAARRKCLTEDLIHEFLHSWMWFSSPQYFLGLPSIGNPEWSGTSRLGLKKPSTLTPGNTRRSGTRVQRKEHRYNR